MDLASNNSKNIPGHVRARRGTRRIIMWIAFLVTTILGTVSIVLGLTDDQIAARISDMSGFLGLFFGGMYAIIAGYFGVGALENTSPVVYGYSGYAMGSQYQSYNPNNVGQMHGSYAGPSGSYAPGNPFGVERGFQGSDIGHGEPPTA